MRAALRAVSLEVPDGRRRVRKHCPEGGASPHDRSRDPIPIMRRGVETSSWDSLEARRLYYG